MFFCFLVFWPLIFSGFVLSASICTGDELCISQSIEKDVNLEEVKDVWVNIFVHGTFASSFCFFSTKSVEADVLEESLYKKVVDYLRCQEIFFNDQPICTRGLIKLEPSFLKKEEDRIPLAAKPVAKIFDIFTKIFCERNEQSQEYYLFGWSGYLSQNYRRLEAFSLYNNLCEIKNNLEMQGLVPKFRIIAHSHGANVALNLAGVIYAVNTEQGECFYKNFENGKQIQNYFLKQLMDLPLKKDATPEILQSKLFRPESNLEVEELVLLGAPIQVETELFAHSGFFSKVFNLFSLGDKVQISDFVSTAAKKSTRTIRQPGLGNNKLFQVQLAMCSQPDCLIAPDDCQKDLSPDFYEISSWSRALIEMFRLTRKTADPTHNELWSLVPQDVDRFKLIRPIPFVCFFPLFRKLILEANESVCKIVTHRKNDRINFALIKDQNILFNCLDLCFKEIELLKTLLEKWTDVPHRFLRFYRRANL